jgi:hypothetical protein
MLPSLGLQTDNRVLRWGMFTGDSAHNVLSFASGQSMRVEEPTVCSCSATRAASPSCCGCESTLSDERILEVRCGGRRRHTCTSHVRGARTLSRCTWRGVRLPGNSTLGEWVTLAFTTRAMDRRARSTRAAGGDVHGRADRRHRFRHH